MKILARYIMFGTDGVQLERVACTIDLKHGVVELLHPTASVFEAEPNVQHCVQFNDNLFALTVDPQSHSITLTSAGWSNLKHGLEVAFKQEHSGIFIMATQEFCWSAPYQFGSLPADEMTLKVHCFVEYDTGEIVKRVYSNLPNDTHISAIALLCGSKRYAVKKGKDNDVYAVLEPERLKIDVQFTWPAGINR